jgi:hypothetical protein
MTYRIPVKFTLSDGFHFLSVKMSVRKRKSILFVFFGNASLFNTCFLQMVNTLQPHCNHIATTLQALSNSYQIRTRFVPNSYQVYSAPWIPKEFPIVKATTNSPHHLVAPSSHFQCSSSHRPIALLNFERGR